MTGLIPDTPPLYEYLTSHQYIAFVSSLYGVAETDRLAHGNGLLEALGLQNRAHDLCKGYSHGMRDCAAVWSHPKDAATPKRTW